MMTVLAAPPALDLETRARFRRDADAALADVPAGGTLVIDLSATRVVDSAGLGTLVVVQRAASGADVSVRLVGVSHDMQTLLTVTRLADLFEIERRDTG